MKKTYLQFFSAFLLFVVMSGCASISKLVEKKKYDRAIDKAVAAFQKSSKRDVEDVKALETAFNEATKNDLRMIKLLKDEKREENWVRINELYGVIRGRQQKVQTVSPTVASDGYAATYNFIDVQAEMSESAAKSAELYYNKGAKLLQEATTANDRFKARDAYNEFVQMEKYDKNFKDGQTLKGNAAEQGMTTVLLVATDATGRNLLLNFGDSLFASPPYKNDNWTRYIRQDYGPKVHYSVTVTFQAAAATPNTNDSREFKETALVQDGVEYIRDANGQLVLDSKGDPTTKPKMVEVNCMIKEVKHHKTATVSALVDIWDKIANKSIAQQVVSGSHLYEYYTASLISGDPRAASADTNVKIKNRVAEFPTDDAMISLAAPKVCKPARDFFAAKASLIK